MEEDLSTLIVEGSDSNNSYSDHGTKRARTDINGAFSPRFKGVVPQQNGHWGAQIYANHQRIWIGTFNSEKEAAVAYDRASINLRSGDTHRNIPWSNLTIHEPMFQNNYSSEAVLDMIKDGSYQSKYSEFLKSQSDQAENTMNLYGNATFVYRNLFQKELTPSDVGKLNRLVIPKKYAVKFFPRITSENDMENVNVSDVLLVFYDKFMRPWKFRYCYWRSSQSFVFTRGWNRFVKEKNLNTKDTVTFHTCELPEKAKEEGSIFLIDVNYHDDRIVKKILLEDQNSKQISTDQLRLDKVEVKSTTSMEIHIGKKRKAFRLFGVQISSEYE